MKKILMMMFCLTLALGSFAQGMSDTQVMQFIQREAKAGTSQSQIVTKLMQRGVKIDQIRRIRAQYDKQLKQRSLGAVADAAVSDADNRMRRNNGTLGRTGNANDEATPVRETVTADYADDYGFTPTDAMLDSISGLVNGKRVFGRDIFNNRNLSFEPNMNLATPQNYVLGPGDQVVIDIYGASQKTETLTVSPDGTVTVPGYGPIQVSGLTVAAARQKLRSSLGSRYASSNLDLSLGQTRTIMVNVMGEVRVPGTYTLSAFATVFHALYMAGGVSELGTLRNIKVYRQGRQVTVVDIYEYILNGRLAGNVRLQDNDVIQVGTYDCIVDIAGNVKRPMAYEMRNNESVKTLLKYSGGFTANAYKKSVRLLRKSGRYKSVYNVDEFDMASFKVDDGDSVSVDSIYDRYENMVEIKGAVFRPGMYQLGEGINSVKSLIEHADGLTEEAFTARAVMHRMRENRTLEVLSVDVEGILNGTVADVPLRNEDVLFIPTMQDRMSERTLTISGEVQYPGTYAFAENETLEDLVLQAGGLTDAASTVKVDVSRRIRDPKSLQSGQEISKTYSFSLKDGFVIEGTPGFVLEAYDVVQVRKSPGYLLPRNVRVEGEVAFEGDFTLEKKNQRLSDVIKMAGGVTDQAYVRGARLERRMTEDERARMQAAIQLARQTATGKDSINLAQLETSETFPVGIHLDEALANPGSDADIVLREGDRLIVPEYNGTVKISGNVLYPITVAYNSGKNFKYYVNQAGGFGQRSKKSKTYIIYQNGTGSLATKGKIEPGCELVVPQKPERNASSLMQWVSLGTSFASLATMIASIANLLK
ncbi:MAG: SLBB domain-containing protein [Prevotella sp.]|nr:SLBB domain-containing protein [Prevotella sp.]